MAWFLTESGFRNSAPLVGAIQYEGEEGERTALVVLQGFVDNQGDAWAYTQDYLKRFLDDCLQEPEKVRQAGDEVHALYRIFATTLGQRTGELHRTLAQTTGDPAFDPKPITADDLADWLSRIRSEAITSFERLEQKRISCQSRRAPWPSGCWRHAAHCWGVWSAPSWLIQVPSRFATMATTISGKC